MVAVEFVVHFFLPRTDHISSYEDRNTRLNLEEFSRRQLTKLTRRHLDRLFPLRGGKKHTVYGPTPVTSPSLPHASRVSYVVRPVCEF